ncbi:MAG: hypothetical protein QM619_01375 [Micropruina sp.]|uniref:hypothetical protein n=1 Tax=Micropruina sp. TaxID=2737536 RepID=UPI0039E71297
MKTFRMMVVTGMVLVFGGGVALYAGGLWADQNASAGNPALWLIPLVGLAIAAVGVSGRARQARRPVK